jgi:hypothetical protein
VFSERPIVSSSGWISELAADDDGVYIGILRAPGPRVGSGPGGGPGILFS